MCLYPSPNIGINILSRPAASKTLKKLYLGAKTAAPPPVIEQPILTQ